MINKYLIFGDEDLHEYDIIEEVNDDYKELTLYLSKAEHWTMDSRGKKMLSLKDDGNNVTFDKELKCLTYSELEYVRILSSLNNKLDDGELNGYNLTVIKKGLNFII